jgi:hypothetical protein
MSDQHYYQYAFALPGCSVQEIGPGVDPRFAVELLSDGPIAAVASRVGMDRFDVHRLQGQTLEDIGWLKQVAIRHSQIVHQAAGSSPVLPLRLGTIFRSRNSLLAAAERCRKTVADFLRTLGNRQEWAVKLYQEDCRVEQSAAHTTPPPPHHPLMAARAGTEYLKQKRAQLQRHRESHAELEQEIQAVEDCLKAKADRYCRVCSLPAGLTGRRERMVFNTAFLLSPSEARTWLAAVERIRQHVRRKGLVLEVTGPWPPYHFCPAPDL